MRSSLLSRSVIAIASLAVGSVALAAAPSGAATASGITREQVLTAAAGVRAAPPGTTGVLFEEGAGYGSAANRAIKGMINRVCITDPDGPELLYGNVSAATVGGGSADGLVVSVYLLDLDASAAAKSTVGRICSFGALATTGLRSVLAGNASLGGVPTTALSGDVYVTPPVNQPFTNSPPEVTPAFAAWGNAVQSNPAKVADKKTTKEKKAAKKKYAQRIASAKKKYAKALDKAGSSKSKKKAAKAAYKAKRSAAKATYRYAIANYKIVTTKATTPFAVSAQYVFDN